MSYVYVHLEEGEGTDERGEEEEEEACNQNVLHAPVFSSSSDSFCESSLLKRTVFNSVNRLLRLLRLSQVAKHRSKP